ncbi:uncharacterized protein AMSG_08386 [Thecamonas trahens ATCC 50062]|uniref:Uncharacterized protein n=1 Tax=Thecamonas trahens ATCC 50062 TaxID=461836 RepID=A0A0L0DJZ0_THETB|nr:hypothetical protein AMSG_08386 [Thecamonas trahens ATCC 50062]KNC52411.1 hypothetical protein AMSG_08386 [Thecamonas trahens ATCC 50062]|eukprot:XP_013755454.1 hypothetical protein AMSG_08386 [Thecamonas trahens ATCC 50062]
MAVFPHAYVGSSGPHRERPQRRIRISYTIEDAARPPSHRFGVNALAVDRINNRLYTAGRDSTIISWEMGATRSQGRERREPSAPVASRVLAGHIDWVNDLVLFGDDNRMLMSASSDTSVVCWDTSTGDEVYVMNRHADYVKALAYLPTRGLMASAGLDNKICLWDVANVAASVELTGHKDSVYALAAATSAPILASGSSEKLVRLWDARSHRKIGKLKGHTDIVKTLAVDASGSLILSGGSDGLVKLWDVGTRKCLASYRIHGDSVWSLRASDSLTHFYSASRDGSIAYSTLRSGPDSVLSVRLAQLDHQVLALAPTHTPGAQKAASPGLVWVGTTTSSPVAFATPEPDLAQDLSSSVYVPPHTAASASGVVATPRNALPPNTLPAPRALAPVATLPGTTGIVRHQILADRRHALTQDNSGLMQVWDVTRGVKISDLPNADDWDEELKTQNDNIGPVAVPSWLTLDSKTGGLTVHLTQPQCFAAEVFAEDLNLTPCCRELPEPGTRINIGHVVLKSIFRHAIRQFLEEHSAKARRAARRAAAHTAPAPADDDVYSDEGTAGRATGSAASASASTSAVSKSSRRRRRHRNSRHAGRSGRRKGKARKKRSDTAGEEEQEEEDDDGTAPLSASASRSLGEDSSNDSRTSQDRASPPIPGAASAELDSDSCVGSAVSSSSADAEEQAEDALLDLQRGESLLPWFFDLADSTRVVATEEPSGRKLLSLTVGAMHSKWSEINIETWLHNALWENVLWANEPSKILFTLEPRPNSDLAALSTTGQSLQAARVYRVKRVAAHVFNQLGLDREGYDPSRPCDAVAVYCRSTRVGPAVDLRAIRHHYWCAPDDLCLTYDRAAPAPHSRLPSPVDDDELAPSPATDPEAEEQAEELEEVAIAAAAAANESPSRKRESAGHPLAPQPKRAKTLAAAADLENSASSGDTDTEAASEAASRVKNAAETNTALRVTGREGSPSIEAVA